VERSRTQVWRGYCILITSLKEQDVLLEVHSRSSSGTQITQSTGDLTAVFATDSPNPFTLQIRDTGLVNITFERLAEIDPQGREVQEMVMPTFGYNVSQLSMGDITFSMALTNNSVFAANFVILANDTVFETMGVSYIVPGETLKSSISITR
jgi:hypothetical protein